MIDKFKENDEIWSKIMADHYQKIKNKPWVVGDKILNRYEIIDIKQGGMGIVYIVFDREQDAMFAVKTFQDKYFWNEDIIQRFISEAETWTDLERHTNIVHSNFIFISEGKPLLFLDYIDGGDLTQFIGKLNILEALDFAIQFCTGMEYAYQNLGMIHRDIKPGNVMVQKDPRFKSGYVFKITDFGLVKALGDEFRNEFVEVSTGIGTLPFMPPEQFPNGIQEKFSFKGYVTTKSDIYSFGVTLFLLLTKKLPFSGLNENTYLDEIFTKQTEHPRNLNSSIPENLDRLIIKCLEKNPLNRYNNFTELKTDLMGVYFDHTRENYIVVGKKEALTVLDWISKGIALHQLGKLQDAVKCYAKALEINPRNSIAWCNKGTAHNCLGENEEAINCFDNAIDLDSKDVLAWTNKGLTFFELGKFQESIICFNRATDIDPLYQHAWNNKGIVLEKLRQFQEAIECYDKAIEINPRSENAWCNKGGAFYTLRKPREAIECYNKALEINPRCAAAWNNKGTALESFGSHQAALECYKKAIMINPQDIDALNNIDQVKRTINEFYAMLKRF